MASTTTRQVRAISIRAGQGIVPSVISSIDMAIPAEAGDHGAIAGLACVPPDARWLYVLAHGAGAGMRHDFMVAIAAALAGRGIATLRWETPGRTAGKARPDPAPRVMALARSACAHARATWPDLRLCAGGKSMGGRMTSQAQAEAALPGVQALVFLGFPLHPAGEPSIARARHLADVQLPMLFVQGDRDKLADLALLRPVIDGLGARATLRLLAGVDHGFAAPKKAGIDPVAAAADAIAGFLAARE
jgi:predicted alpha/beta-hydrolase family hydrolase